MSTVSAMSERVAKSGLPRSAMAVAVLFCLIGLALLTIGRKDYPNLHTVLDTGMSLLSGVLALLLWDMGQRTGRRLPVALAVGFAVTFALEIIHVTVSVEWSGPLAPIVQAAAFLRPATWPPAAYVLPFATAVALWLLHREGGRLLPFAIFVVAAAGAFFALFQWLPAYSAPGLFGITRPKLSLVPLLWAGVGLASWRMRASDRILPPLAAMAAILVLAHVSMLYSRAPHDTQAMVAHLGKMSGYLILLLCLMRRASMDMLERIQAEHKLAHLNESLERRVLERTAELESTNKALAAEADVRLQAERKTQAQLARLDLLHQITRAIGDRQDLGSIFQVVVRSVEDQLPVDFGCLCLYEKADHALTVASVGTASSALALELAMPERARVDIDENGLSRCVRGQLVYEPDMDKVQFPFPQRLVRGGLRSLVVAPLQVESQVFGVLVVARRQAQGFNSGECEFLRQLSEHVALAAHQAQLYKALQQAYDDLRQTQQAVMQQERLRALGQMASGIAHDINNAISPIALYTESLLESETNLSGRAHGYLKTIQRAVEDVAQTVARMREFYRQREPQLALTTVQLNNLVQQVMDLTRARWRDMPMQSGIVINAQADLAADLPAIRGVESEIRESLINLILNAVDAMPTGGSLVLRTKVVNGGGGHVSGHVRLDVADTGAGMDEDTRRRCLEPFFTTKGERGTGLGLAMVYGVMQRHGAEIEIESAPGEGTTISLSFPASVAAPDTSGRVGSTGAMPPRLRLLLVDDDPLLLKSLQDTLELDGHIVVAINGGQEGIDAFHAARERGEAFSVVITDLGMPYVDGRRVASAVKDASSSTPVILLTGWGQRLVADNEIPPHVDYVLSKPPKLHELRDALVACCQKT